MMISQIQKESKDTACFYNKKEASTNVKPSIIKKLFKFLFCNGKYTFFQNSLNNKIHNQKKKMRIVLVKTFLPCVGVCFLDDKYLF